MKSKKKTQVAKNQSGKESESEQVKTKIVPKIQLEVDENGNRNFEVKLVKGKKLKRRFAGTEDWDLLCNLIGQVLGSLPPRAQTSEQEMNASVEMLIAIDPQDELEAALAVQMIGIHNTSMEMLCRAMHPEQTTEGVSENINRAVKLTRTYTAQMEALRKYRNKGQQTIQVQHVSVEYGGRAVVGNVNTGGGGEK